MTWILGLVASFMLGWIALSSEMIWYRAYSFGLSGHAQVFGTLIAAYVSGLAAGAAFASKARAATTRLMPVLIVFGSITGFAVVPLFATIITGSANIVLAFVPVLIGAAWFGALFPVLAAAVIADETRAGTGIGYLYAANIAGSTAGSLLTGLVLLDHLTLAQTALAVSLVGLLCALVSVALTKRRGDSLRRAVYAVALLTAIGAAVIARGSAAYGQLYERLLAKRAYRPSEPFARVIETRAGVIVVTREGEVYGDGVYDGAINLDLHRNVNGIHRAFVTASLHPAPREVLMIGLSTGSWAAVLANNPAVERLTIVEINPGYLGLIPNSPDIASALGQPKVRIEIADGRRWLMAHRERYDMVIANTLYHWRSNASRLLSAEFLALVRSRLRAGGVYYFNATGSERATRTALTVFPFGWRVDNMLAVSESPILLDLNRFRDQMLEYRVGNRPVINSTAPDREFLDQLIVMMRNGLEPGTAVLERTAPLEPITDDNMGDEWTLPRTVAALFHRDR